MRSLSDAELDRAFAALADPTRRAILARLRTGEPDRRKDVVDWLGTYREFWEASFTRLDAYVETLGDEEAT